MVATASRLITLEEFLKLPETKPASEYIDGAIIQKPMPKGRHSGLQSELCTHVNQTAKAQKVAYAFPELRCTCRLGWFIDPDDGTVLAFLPNQQPELMQGSDRLPVLEEIDLELTVDQVFDWLLMGQ